MAGFNVAIRFAATAAIGLSLAQAAHAQSGETAWKAGKMTVSGALTTSGSPCESDPDGRCVGTLKPGKHPVIVFMHGCGGPRPPKVFFGLNAIIVAPNSFTGGVDCDEGNREAMGKLLRARLGEAGFAAGKLKASAWADPDKMILAGFSQGGQVSAIYPGNEYKARIVIAYPCQSPVAAISGVRGSGPVLAVMSADDEYFKKLGVKGNCGSVIAQRPGSKSVVLPGKAHDMLDTPKTREAVAAFVPEMLK